MDSTPPNRSPVPGRAVAWALMAAGFLLLWGTTPWWWFGIAGMTVAASVLSPGLRSALPRWRPGPRVVDAGCALLVMLVAWLMLDEVAAGDRPVSHDHPVHYFKAWQATTEMLPEGRMWGWSHRLFAGYPAGYLYPIGPDLWVALVHLLGPGADVSESYALAFALVHVLTGYGVYRLGERTCGPWAGLVAAVLFLTDFGEFRYGGWKYTIDYGVWPQTFSLAFVCLALARVPAIIATPRWAPVGTFALFTGLSLICHPMPILLFPVVFVVVAVLRFVTPASDLGAPPGMQPPGPGAGIWRLGVAHLVGAVISLLWLLPFLSTKDMADRYGVLWRSAYQIGASFIDLDLLKGTWGVAFIAGVAGVAMLLRRTEWRGRFVAWTTILLLAAAVSSIVDEFHLNALTEAFEHIQFSRLTILLKPFFFIAAGWALVAAWRWLLSATDSPTPPQPASHRALWARAARNGVLALILGPIVVSFAFDFYTRQIDRELPRLSERKDQEHRDALVAWLNAQPHESPVERVAFVGRTHDHSVVDMAAAIERPIYKTGFTPCSNYVYKMRTDRPTMMGELRVRWGVSDKKLSGGAWREIEQFGPWKVHELKRFDPDPLTVSDGKGPVELVSWADEEIVVRAGAGAHGYLRLPVSHFPRWHATRDGHDVEIEPWEHPADKERSGFMTVALQPGEYRFEFRRSGSDRAAPWIGLIGVLLALLLMLADTRLPAAPWLGRSLTAVGEWLDGLLVRWPGAVPIGSGVVLVLVTIAALALAAWTPPVPYEGSPSVDIGDVQYDFLERLDEAVVHVMADPEPVRCPWRLDRFVCRPSQWFHVASRPERLEGYSERRCISVHPNPDGPVQLRFPSVPAGDGIAGYYGITDSGKKGRNRAVRLTVHVDGQQQMSKVNRRDARTHWFYTSIDPARFGDDGEAEVVFTVEADDTHMRHFCFYAQMVDRADL